MPEPVTLTTERLTLRPYRFEDVDAIMAYVTDPDWSRYLLPVREHYTRTDAEEYIAGSILLDWKEHLRWAIVHEGVVSGGFDLRVDHAKSVGEIGYSLAPELWGRGLTPEAAGAVLDWAFPHFDLEKVCAFADSRNTQSWRVMEKLGMQREGLFRSARVHRGERFDEVWYGILRGEWESTRGVAATH